MYTTGNATITLTGEPASVTVAASLDVDALKAVMLAGAPATKHTLINAVDGGDSLGIQTNYTSNGSIIQTSGIYGCWGANTTAYSVGIDAGPGFETETFWANAVSAAVSLTYSYNTGTSGALSVVYADNTIKEFGGTFNTSLKGSTLSFDSIDFHDSIVTGTFLYSQGEAALSAEDVKALSTAAAQYTPGSTPPTPAWTVDMTGGAYNPTAPINTSDSSSTFENGVGVKTTGEAANGSGIVIVAGNGVTQPLRNEFSISMTLASVNTTFSDTATNEELTLMAVRKSDTYTFSLLANSQTGALTLNLGGSYIAEGSVNNNLCLSGNTSAEQTIVLTFGNIEGSGNALVSAYLNGELAVTAIMNANWRTDHAVSASLTSGFNQKGIAAIVSGIEYYNTVIVPEPPPPVTELHWKGTGTTANWSDDVWAGAADGTGDLAYKNDVPVYFGDNGISGMVEINVDSSVNPTGMTISGGDYKFTGTSPLDNTDALSITGGAAEFAMDIDTATTSVSNGASLTTQALSVKNALTIDGSIEAASVDAGSIIINTTGSLNTTGEVEVGTGMQMNGGSLSANKLTGNGGATINAGKVELTNGADTSSLSIKDGVTLKGNTSLSGTETNLQIGNVKIESGANVSISETALASGATVEGGSLTVNGVTLGKAIAMDGGTLTLEGNIQLDNKFVGEDEELYSLDGTTVDPSAQNGYKKTDSVYIVVTGDLSSATVTSTATWSGDGNSADTYTFELDTTNNCGKVYRTGAIDTSTNYINADAALADLNLAKLDADGTILINNSTLTIDGTYNEDAVLEASTNGGTIQLDADGVLRNDHIAAGTGELILDGTGYYYTGSSDDLHESGKVALAESWVGTVDTGDLTGEALDISALSTASSAIAIGDISAQNIQLRSLLRTTTPKAAYVSAQDVVLTEGASHLDAAVVSMESLTLGNDTTAASLEITGELDMQGDITLGNEGSALTAQSLSDTTEGLNFVMRNKQLNKLGTETVVLTLAEAADDVTLTLNSAYEVAADKYSYTIDWDSEGKQAIITAALNETYYTDSTEDAAGPAAMIAAMVKEENPQATAPDSDLAGMLNSLDGMISNNSVAAADSLMTAVAGASTAAMGAALSGDMHRQLRAIRNRTTTMGVNQSVVNADMPYFNAWINAEANHAELGDDGLDSGYSLNMAGGTVGFDVDINPTFTAGLAFTAMYGDFSAESADKADGDLNAYYLTAFARHTAKRWTHTFVASIGLAETQLKRTVSHTNEAYSTKGDSDGFSLGAMYEVGYVYALDEDATACLQPVLNFTFTHSSVGGYTESDSDAALKVGDMDMTTFTIGAGARLQAAVGDNMYNRSSILEARALVKLNAGDTNCEGDVAFASLPGAKADISSAEVGTIGLELGVGLTIPMQDDNSALFFDASAEISSGYTNANATAGYRYNF